MLFDRSVYPKETTFHWSNHRQAAAKRRVTLDLEKNALTPELARWKTADERRDFLERTHNPAHWHRFRAFEAAMGPYPGRGS